MASTESRTLVIDLWECEATPLAAPVNHTLSKKLCEALGQASRGTNLYYGYKGAGTIAAFTFTDALITLRSYPSRQYAACVVDWYDAEIPHTIVQTLTMLFKSKRVVVASIIHGCRGEEPIRLLEIYEP